jgi:hypothetical protein
MRTDFADGRGGIDWCHFAFFCCIGGRCYVADMVSGTKR